jgi:hypothetical protein
MAIANHSGLNITLGSWFHISNKAYMPVLFLCLCCPVKIATLRRPDPPSTGSKQLSLRLTISELILNGNKPDSLIHEGRRRRKTEFRESEKSRFPHTASCALDRSYRTGFVHFCVPISTWLLLPYEWSMLITLHRFKFVFC